ncbi:MAG: NusG domain II-containing protein [Hespellia sp.]|jgi:hypothetical protein|nr:NusG domain II-containing protein [Hespellia sp.]
MKKNDWILVGSVLLIAGIWFLARMFLSDTHSGMVTVTVNGEEFGTYSLEKEQTIDIHGTNQLVIQDGCADMVSANCPDQICVHQHAISRRGESIVCLPNKVVVTVDSGEEADLDGVSN